MQSHPVGRLAAQPCIQRKSSTSRRASVEAHRAGASHIAEPKQRAAPLVPSSLDAALLSRLTIDSSSLSQLDPLSGLERCPPLYQGPVLELPSSQRVALPQLQLAGLAQPSAATLHEPRPVSRKPEKDPKGEDFYANVGYAIRTLRDELPCLFQEDLTYDIYRDDIAFKDPRNCIEGKRNYRTIFWSLRFHGALFFTKLRVDVQRIWQPDEALIRARWTVRGEPRVPWRAQGIFDGISEFKLDSNGKIYQHKVDNTVLNDPPYMGLPVLGLNLFGRPAVQPQVPGAFFRNGPQHLLQGSSSSSTCSNRQESEGPSSPAPV